MTVLGPVQMLVIGFAEPDAARPALDQLARRHEAADGLGEDEFGHVDDAIPAGAAALVAVVEHRWALPLQDALQDAGGFHLADAWLHSIDLVSAGVIGADEIG